MLRSGFLLPKFRNPSFSLSYKILFGLQSKKNPHHFWWGFLKKGGDILSHRIAVPSAQAGLTSLFGMGRGEPRRNNHLRLFSLRWATCPSSLAMRSAISWHTGIKISIKERKFPPPTCIGGKVRISLRVISTTRLWHYCLYTYSLSTWSSPTTLKRNLILWWVSRLYAFSAYPFPT